MLCETSKTLKKNKDGSLKNLKSKSYATKHEAILAAKKLEHWLLLDFEDNIICDASDRVTLNKLLFEKVGNP